MVKLLGIPGALRKASFNRSLLRAAVSVAPAGVTLEVASIDDIPLYDGDVEAVALAKGGFPAPVARLRAQLAAADALLLVSPEYNQSVPGVLKNALDWLSRAGPNDEDVCKGKPVALIGATPGLGGTRMAQTAWLPVFRALGLKPWFGRQLYVAGAGKVFDKDGNLVDDKVRGMLITFIAEYAAEVARTRPA
jgi:chromate reductase, NAD(P)H dehydrogenase (quinone)